MQSEQQSSRFSTTQYNMQREPEILQYCIQCNCIAYARVDIKHDFILYDDSPVVIETTPTATTFRCFDGQCRQHLNRERRVSCDIKQNGRAFGYQGSAREGSSPSSSGKQGKNGIRLSEDTLPRNQTSCSQDTADCFESYDIGEAYFRKERPNSSRI